MAALRAPPRAVKDLRRATVALKTMPLVQGDRLLAASCGLVRNGFRFLAASGALIEVQISEKTSPDK